MLLLAIGLVIFFTIHVFSSTRYRPVLVGRLGEKPYKGSYALLALLGLVLIIYGKAQAPFIAVWHPPYWTRYIVFTIMPLALLCLAMPDLPNNLRRFIPHPMMTGILLWAAAHLTTNGDLASMLIFGCFLLYAIYTLIPGNTYKPAKACSPVPWYRDVILVVAVIIGTLLIMRFHRYVSGVPLF
ncbi:NnrU family protein [Maricurvus nonylphenolicus]|uniref:NnrU family protein n=1 Tax=Maricurvus nonylphenolicus TaxID=1008307 RepID=UPI0036F42663